MNPLKKLLVVIASAGVMGSAQAFEQARSPDILPAPNVSTSNSSVNLNMPSDANYRLASAAVVSYAPAAGTVAEMDRPSDGTRIDLRRAAFNLGAGTTAKSGRADGEPGESRFSVAGIPEPAEWMQLLCGLVIAGFIARRRTNHVVG